MKLYVVGILSLVLISCSKSTPPLQAPQETKTQAVSNMPEGGSSISGQVLFEGTPPPATPSAMASFPECAAAHPQGVTTEDILVKDGKLQNVFIYVKEGITGSYPPPKESVTLDQKGCLYKPHVLGVQVGQPFLIINSDPMIHNIHALAGGDTVFNVAMPAQGQKLTQTFTTPQVMVGLKCDIHGWMKSYVGVLTHPFFALTDALGRFELKGLPPGEYTIAAWHERFGEKTQQITLGKKANNVLHTLEENETKLVLFTFTPQ